ncbi:hypothetical protein D1AOALGA4SA_11470 [Olavius algarvensis Delta 1 endosymbiont]|nr:hypothetical protein D1AOALGA4SA_11470 [Olavius algarvensis Delta 1 endosymbiont]
MDKPVHPHACGEHQYACLAWTLRSGSSPRLWGTLLNYKPDMENIRFIPTPVGNTDAWRSDTEWDPVHPHACGEHLVIDLVDIIDCGSSPRLWGTRLKQRRSPGLHRFIPTPVGNTRAVILHFAFFPVHPHACGEHR